MTNIVSGGRGGYFGSDYFLMLQGCSITTTRKHAYPKVYVYCFHDCLNLIKKIEQGSRPI